MNNTEIIYKTAISHGIPQELLDACLQRGHLPFHTIPEWSRMGYHVKTGEAPLFDCYLWKHTNKPSAATIAAAVEAGKDAPTTDPHFYQKLSYIYGPQQVTKNAAAPDLATLKAQLDALPGLAYKVKGEKSGAPNVWITSGADEHAAAIEAMGGIWSNKKSAYWIKPSTAPAPADDDGDEDAPADLDPAPAPVQSTPAAVRLALPAPARLLELPAHVEEPAPAPVPGAAPVKPKKNKPEMVTLTIHPGKPTPQPWKKCSFYTIRRGKDGKPAAELVDGFTDGFFNYYSAGDKSKTWHAIQQECGLAVATANTRKAAQADALSRLEKVIELMNNPDAKMVQYGVMIKRAQDGDNTSLF